MVLDAHGGMHFLGPLRLSKAIYVLPKSRPGRDVIRGGFNPGFAGHLPDPWRLELNVFGVQAHHPTRVPRLRSAQATASIPGYCWSAASPMMARIAFCSVSGTAWILNPEQMVVIMAVIVISFLSRMAIPFILSRLNSVSILF
jgi:hypothetical protein